VYIHTNILVLHPGTNHKTRATSKGVYELHYAMLSKVSSLPRVRDALQKMLRVLSRNRRPFKWVLFAFQDDDRWLADVQTQRIRSIGMNKMKKIVDRIHAICYDNINHKDRKSGNDLICYSWPAQSRDLPPEDGVPDGFRTCRAHEATKNSFSRPPPIGNRRTTISVLCGVSCSIFKDTAHES